MITVTINNYNGKKITYTMSDDAEIRKMMVSTINTNNNSRLTNVSLELVDFSGITEKEEINEQTNKEKETETKE